MSTTASNAVLAIRGNSLTVAERYVLLVFAVHARQPDDPDAPLEAWPTAATVAAETGLTREHVQRCLASLQGHGLLRQTGRKRGRANVYQVSLRRIQHLGSGAPVVEPQITPTSDVRSHLSVISDHTEQEGEQEGNGTAEAGAADAAAEAAAAVAKAVYDTTDGAVPFMGVRQIALWAVKRRGADPDQVTAALVGLYRAGRPTTKVLLGQVLDGIVRVPGFTVRQNGYDDRRAGSDYWAKGGQFLQEAPK